MVVIAIAVLAARPFVWPTDDVPFGDGPVVVLGGGGGERLSRALAIVGEEPNRTLVLSAEAINVWRATGGRCSPEQIVCISPEPVNTFGEAVAVAALVEERRWERVTVVTSDFHVTRTRWLFERCVDVPVRVVVAPTNTGFGHRTYLVAREMAATLVAVARRSCA